MRFLHTSDWHLGQNFMGKSRLPEHRAFFAWLLEQVKQHEISAIIVAGDVFDTGTPPSYARELYNQLVIDLHQLDCQLIVLAGNHDSIAVLNESKNLLAQLSTRVITQPADELTQQLVLLSRQQQPFALVAAIPFLRPRDMLLSQAGESSVEKKQALQQAIAAHYQKLFAAAQAFLAEQRLQLPIVLTGHLTTLGASLSESVRDIYVGNLKAFPSDAFPPADYIALGHIHRPQQVAGQAHVRYSGSPIPLSFDEVGRDKQVVLVECAKEQVVAIEELTVPLFQPLVRIVGDLSAIEQQLQQVAIDRPGAWLEIEVQHEAYLTSLAQRIDTLCEGLPLEVLRIKRQRSAATSLTSEDSQTSLAELSVEQVFAQRLAEEQLTSAQQQQLEQLHQQVLTQLLDPLAEASVSSPDKSESV